MKTAASTLPELHRSRDRAIVANGAARRSAASRTRIVVVDDHPITLAGLNFLLAADFTVLARCADAHEALQAVRIYEPDVLIIDQDMPTIGGVDVLKQLRAAGDQTPVVLLATANNSKLMEALAFKVEGIVFKQSDPKRLIRCVRDVQIIAASPAPRCVARIVVLTPASEYTKAYDTDTRPGPFLSGTGAARAGLRAAVARRSHAGDS